MIQVADNFNYRGKKPNFDRDSFDTLQDMKNYSENSLDDGHISYCKETDKHYKFNSNNQSDPTTGKWVEQHEAVPADEEDITEQNGTLQLANKTYDKQSFSGLGRVYLRKNIVGDKNVLTQAMINKANIIYVIQYDYDLNGQTIVTPSNSILKFDGGSFDNGIVDISNTTDLINPKFNYYLEGAYANITNCSFYKCNKCMRLTQDNVVNNIKVFCCNYFASLNALNILTNCRIDSCKYDGILIYYRGNTVNNVVFDFIYQRSFVLNPGANHNNINFTTLRSGIGSDKKDYSDKNSKYYTIYMQGECNACDINLNITSNNILDSTTENINFTARGIRLDRNFSGVNNKFNINREDINLISSIRNNTLVKDIVKYIDYEDIPTLNMVANLGGVFIEYIKGKPVISGDMYVSKMGTTQERPANIINKGFQYFDTTINKPIYWDGSKWIDATGATV